MVSNKHAYATDSAVRRAAGGGRRTLTTGPGPFGGLGRAVVRHPWLTILAWVVVAVAVIATSPGLPTTSDESSFLPKSYESIRAADLQDKAFPQTGQVTAAAAIIVFSRADGGKLTAADSAKVASVATAVAFKHAAPTIAAAGLILAGTFASLTLAGNTILSQLGFAVSAGIALAAFVIAMFFSPGLTTLIGRWAWWPGHAAQPPAVTEQLPQEATH